MANLKIVIDTTGSEAASKVLLDLLNEYPGLMGDVITFSTLEPDGGISFNPTSGAMFLSNREFINGHVKQVCAYPFVVIYRAAPASEIQKIRIKEWLDRLGQWLERQPVLIGDEVYQLDKYPELSSGNRVIKTIETTNSAHCQAAYADGVEDWSISLSMRYENEFDK